MHRKIGVSDERTILLHGQESEGEVRPLILKRARSSRPSGEWSEDDYDVPAEGPVESNHPVGPEVQANARKNSLT